jgi:hypothetical protein
MRSRRKSPRETGDPPLKKARKTSPGAAVSTQKPPLVDLFFAPDRRGIRESVKMYRLRSGLSGALVALAIPILRSRFLAGARIKGRGTFMDKTPRDPTDPIEQLRDDPQALAALFERHRDRLRRMVELRLDPRLRARLDASDVVQDAFLDVARDLDAYLADPKLPPLLWLRLHVGRRPTITRSPSATTATRPGPATTWSPAWARPGPTS